VPHLRSVLRVVRLFNLRLRDPQPGGALIMGAIRRSRTVRPPLGRYAVVDRDRLVLRAIGRMRLAPTSFLTRLYFGTPQLTARRLAKLASLGFVTAHVPSLNEENVWTLTQRGHRLLVDAGVEPAELHAARGIPRSGHLHGRMINELRVGLVEASRRDSAVTIDVFKADWDLRREAGLNVPPYVPDALIRVRTPTGVVGLVCEADTGSETASYVRSRKMVVVGELAAQRSPVWGLRPWKPVLVAATVGRLRRLANVCADAPGIHTWLATTEEALRVFGPLGPVARPFAEIVSLRPTDPFTGTVPLTAGPLAVP
jgi:hypothetical protein